MLQPAKLTLRGEKGAPLTQEEMDDNLRIVRAIVAAYGDNILLAAAIDPSIFSITGHTNITPNTSVVGHADNLAYEADPITITLLDWFDTAVCDSIRFGISTRTDGHNMITEGMIPSSSMSISIPAGVFSGLDTTGDICWFPLPNYSYCPFVINYGTYTA